MSIHLELVDHDEIFRGLSTEAVVVNNINIESEDEKQRLNSLLYTSYEGDTLDVLPSCDCGKLRGEYNVGLKCSICNTEVMTVTERPLESLLWLTAPKGVKSLISPHVWTMLSRALSKKNGFDALRWLTDPLYRYQGRPSPEMEKIKSSGWKRGLNHFIDNFHEIIRWCFEHGIVKYRDYNAQALWEFINQNHTKFFPRYIPIPSRMSFITESTATGVYADMSMEDALDAVRTICSIENAVMPVTQNMRESRTVKSISQLASYYDNFYRTSLGKKPGWFRRHVFGSRLHFSFRGVISSMSANHDYDEIHIPWSMAVMAFKLHLTSKLLRRGFTPNEINQFLYEHTLKHHSLIDELFQELIAESPHRGIPIIFQRNPSLERGSAQLFYITRVKWDVADNTISMSVLTLAAPNADFDGDAMNGMIILDYKMFKALSRLAPHTGVSDLERPRKISGNIKLPPPVLSIIGNWLHE